MSIGMSNMLTVQSVSNSKFYSSSGDQHIQNNFFAKAADSNVDAGESSTCFPACELGMFAMCFRSRRLLLVLEQR
jgi:hypothetical protein